MLAFATLACVDRNKRWGPPVLVCAGLIVLAGEIEFAQAVMSVGRNGALLDLLASTAGVVFAYKLARAVR